MPRVKATRRIDCDKVRAVMLKLFPEGVVLQKGQVVNLPLGRLKLFDRLFQVHLFTYEDDPGESVDDEFDVGSDDQEKV